MADAAPPSTELPPGFDDDKSWVAIFVVVLCLTVATTMVGLRIWTRKFIINKMGMDDWAAIVTLLVTWADGIAIAVSTKYGLGRHIYTLTPPMIQEYLKCFWLSIVFYCAGLLAAKMTFLLQYYRILAVQSMRKFYIAAIIIVGAWGLSQLLIGLLMCRPTRGFWDSSVEAECIPNQPQFYINAAGNIATDVAVFLLPMPAIKHLNLKRSQKYVLFGIFSLGFFTVAISIIRIKFIGVQEDVTWDNIESSGWSIGELTSALTCACLPTLRPFVAKYFPNLGMSRAGTTLSYHGNTIGGSGGDPESKGSSKRSKANRSANETTGSTESFAEKAEYEVHAAEARAHSTEENACKISITDEERLLGLKTTTKTDIRRSNTRSDPDIGAAIQVQRDVYQTNTVRKGSQ